MSIEITYEDEIPEGGGPYERGHHGNRLWAEARWWVNSLLAAFNDLPEIASVGLSRRLALRCRNWLWSVEGMVRRLIIAAALALDPAGLPEQDKASGKASRKTPGKASDEAKPAPEQPRKPSCAFRLFHLHRRKGPRIAPRVFTIETLHLMKTRKKRIERAPLPMHRHLAFPVDDLLALDAASTRRPPLRRPARSRRNPLDRRGRLSRWDPDYTGRSEEDFSRYMFGPFPGRPDMMTLPPPASRIRNHRDAHDPHRFSSGGFEHRRIEEEWARVIPAPDLAGRIAALARVMDKPQRFIERLALLLRDRKGLAARLASQPPPKLEKPKRDATPAPPGLDCLHRCHAAIPRADTS